MSDTNETVLEKQAEKQLGLLNQALCRVYELTDQIDDEELDRLRSGVRKAKGNMAPFLVAGRDNRISEVDIPVRHLDHWKELIEFHIQARRTFRRLFKSTIDMHSRGRGGKNG